MRSSQSKKSKVTNAVTDEVAQEEGRNAEAITDKRPRALSMPSSGGSVIVDKIYEPLQAAIQAYNDRIFELTEIPKKLHEYPNARAKMIALATNSQLIRDMQTMLEGSPLAIVGGLVSQNPNLETILEATPSVEIESVKIDSMHQERDLHADLTKQASEARISKNGIPKVEKQRASKLWVAVKKHVDEERF